MKDIRTIQLNESTVKVLTELRGNVLVAQKTIEAINARMTDILTGICLVENVDLNSQSIRLADDMTTLTVAVVETETSTEVVENVSPQKKTSKIRKLE